jgi:hypothetical protein
VRTAKSIYRRFVAFEERAAEIYLRLASRFSAENPELSGAVAGDGHSGKAARHPAGLLPGRRAFRSGTPGISRIRKFAGSFQNLERRAADARIDLNGEFVLALELEGSEVNAIYCHLTTPLHKSLYLLRKKILASPPDHIERLQIAGRKFGADPRILRQLEQLKKSSPKTCF